MLIFRFIDVAQDNDGLQDLAEDVERDRSPATASRSGAGGSGSLLHEVKGRADGADFCERLRTFVGIPPSL